MSFTIKMQGHKGATPTRTRTPVAEDDHCTVDSEASGSEYRPTPRHFIYATDEEDSPVLPHNIRRTLEGKYVVRIHFKDVKGKDAVKQEKFSQWGDACNEAEAKFKPCPIDGRDVPIGYKNIQQLCRYLKREHPDVFQRLKDESNGFIRFLYVFDSGYSIHNKVFHPETSCRFGRHCKKRSSGECSFNHDGQPWCWYDKDPQNRCTDHECPFNHGRGRVAHVIRERSTTPKSKGGERKVPDAPRKKKPDKVSNSFENIAPSDSEEEDDEMVKTLFQEEDASAEEASAEEKPGQGWVTNVRGKKKRVITFTVEAKSKGEAKSEGKTKAKVDFPALVSSASAAVSAPATAPEPEKKSWHQSIAEQKTKDDLARAQKERDVLKTMMEKQSAQMEKQADQMAQLLALLAQQMQTPSQEPEATEEVPSATATRVPVGRGQPPTKEQQEELDAAFE